VVYTISTSEYVQRILNETINSLTTVIPIKLEILPPSLTIEPYEQKELSVLIGLIGGIKGRLLIDTSTDAIDMIGQAMFGMSIEREMVESFTGELGNLVAGNFCTVLEKDSLILDISPPTGMTGATKFFGFKQAFKIPIRLADGELLHV
jgi:chemotaxis protein CheX